MLRRLKIWRSEYAHALVFGGSAGPAHISAATMPPKIVIKPDGMVGEEALGTLWLGNGKALREHRSVRQYDALIVNVAG
jgi:hypothetical protein